MAPERIIHAPYTTDTFTFLAPPHRTAGKAGHRLLFVGLLVERKGLVPFLETLRLWGERHPADRVEFRLAGDGPQREALERMEMPSNIKLRFLGSVPYDQLPALYSESDVSVLPTFADEWGVVVNEAMSAGLPVLGSLHSQAVEELVTDDETGWTFYPDNSESVYAALDRALGTSSDRRISMGAAARNRALQLTPAEIAGRIAEAVRCAIEQPA